MLVPAHFLSLVPSTGHDASLAAWHAMVRTRCIRSACIRQLLVLIRGRGGRVSECYACWCQLPFFNFTVPQVAAVLQCVGCKLHHTKQGVMNVLILSFLPILNSEAADLRKQITPLVFQGVTDPHVPALAKTTGQLSFSKLLLDVWMCF
jgi:hypothetical protein